MTGGRVLVLGAGLGAAGAIALAGAAAASAAPADGRSETSASSVAAGASDPAKPRQSPGRIRAAVVRSAPNSPESPAIASGPDQVRQTRASAPARTSADARVSKRLAGPGTGPAAGPGSRIGSTEPGAAAPRRLITIYKGTHFVIPNQWALWVREDSGAASFTANSAYDLADEDQYDWNKLAGITFTPWRPDRNSMMVVWRYNLKADVFEVGPFFNVDFRYVFPTAEEIITVPTGETFQFHTDYDGITVIYGDRTVYKARPQELAPNFWTSARVTGWFGGNEVAPRTVSYLLRLD